MTSESRQFSLVIYDKKLILLLFRCSDALKEAILALASDLGIDARPFLAAQETVGVQITREEDEPEENWHDCSQDILSDEDFSDLDLLQFIRLQGSDKSRNRIVRVVGNTVQKEENSPGVTILRWIYEELPVKYKDRLQVMYFIHPGLRSRHAFATLGRFFLSGG
ncbi:hypothetical protein K2173_010870 [Erythroxylum novogranatense]|uniref:CRAL-TRIO domain-containing protein n=1 Tax=Erythroxylum novogranatense TaxID=1862640 RepID=A0AAV8T161_9ROSI|nr:hypothetical protein K2173_010870 [Erythroxylum novogranatense]